MPGIEDALLGVALQSLLSAILATRRVVTWRHVLFRKTLQRLETAIESLEPTIREVVALENVPTDTYQKFLDALRKGAKLLDIYRHLRKRDLLWRRMVKKRITEFDEYVQRFLTLDLKAVHSRQIAVIYDMMVRLDAKMDKSILLVRGPDEADAPQGSDLKRTDTVKERPPVGVPGGSSKASEPVVGLSSRDKKRRNKIKVKVKFNKFKMKFEFDKNRDESSTSLQGDRN